MRYLDTEEIEAEPWQADLLALNPSYCSWGPHEDYMWKPGRNEGPDTNPQKQDHGWESRVLVKTWRENPFVLDELNECVNFYFSVTRDSTGCEACVGSGRHPDARWVEEAFYEHSTPFRGRDAFNDQSDALFTRFNMGVPANTAPLRGKARPDVLGALTKKYGRAVADFFSEMALHAHWNKRITADEARALHDSGRLRHLECCRSLAEAGVWQELADHRNSADDNALHMNDATNRMILVEARLKRLGMPLYCDACDGGSVYTEDHAHVSLTLWIIHPRKGASRGVEVARIEREDLPGVMAFLRKAAERNAERFARVVGQAGAK